jgi:hypothetical protein
MTQESVAKKQLGLSVPAPLLETLHGISATSGITMTQLLATALEMIAVVYQTEARGGVVLVHDNQGQVESVLTVPRLGVHQIPATSLQGLIGFPEESEKFFALILPSRLPERP